MNTKVFLVDDHALFRGGLRLLLDREPDLSVVGEAGDGQTALEQVGDLAPDIVVMDINMPEMDGIQTTQRLLAEAPETKIIALSIHSEKGFVQRMLLAGAAGYILKESVPEEVVEGIRVVRRGELYLSAAITDIVVSDYKDFLSGAGAVEDQSRETSSMPLLTTKLYPFPISQRVISRTRLIEQLEVGRWRPLTLVSAPAGYGKSTLVSQWLETIKSECPGVWLSLDENDNDLRGFMMYLVSAIRTRFPEALQDTSLLLKAAALPPSHVVVRTLANELDRIPQRFILVLDDYHHIAEASIHELMAELLRHPPQTTHLVLVTRQDPPLDLFYLQAYQQMGVVRAQALNFTVEETAAFLQIIVGTAVGEDIAKALTEKTEGWVTGLHLITLSVQDSAGLAQMSTIMLGEQQTLDYLAAEALARQPRDVQAWLLKTSILDRFCASLCQAVCAPREAGDTSRLSGQEFIQWLTNSNLFIVPMDHQGRWFRYHSLFQELIHNQLRNALDAGDIAVLHIRASEWFASQGLIEAAIQHALTAGDVSRAVHLVEQRRYNLMNTEQWSRLERWLKLLPPKTIEKNPTLLLTQAYIYEYRGQIAEVFVDLDQAECLLSTLQPESLERKALEGEIAVLRAEQFILSGDGNLAVEWAARALELLPPEALHIWSYAIGVQVLANQIAGDIGRGLKIVNEILNERASLPGITEARMMLWFCIANWMEGDLNGVKQSALRCLKLGEQYALPESIGFGRYFLGVLHYVRNEAAEAERYLAAVVDDPLTVRPNYLIQSASALALIYTSQSRDDEASNVVESMISHTKETHNTLALATAQAFQVELALKQGKALEAQRLGEQAVYDLLPPLWFFYVPQLTPVKLLLAQNTPESLRQALTLLDPLEEYLRKINRKTIRIDLLALQALILDAQGEEPTAFEKLTESLALSEPGGFIRNYVDLGPPMAAMLKRLNRQMGTDALGRFIDAILAAFPATPIVPVQSRGSGLIEPLTERELQVMRLLTSALSAAEIAEELVVSVNTVRMHIKNIYGKLDVHSRIEAVERARDLGLI